MNSSQANGQYEVLSPWADVDAVPLKGISPRVANLSGKKIGLLSNRTAYARYYHAAALHQLPQRGRGLDHHGNAAIRSHRRYLADVYSRL